MKPDEPASRPQQAPDALFLSNTLTDRHFLTGRRVLVIAAVLLGGLAVGAAATSTAEPPVVPEQPAPTARPLAVEALAVEPATGYRVRRSYTGQARALQRSTVGFERGGRVTAVLVREGQPVSAETVLARLDDDQLFVAEEVLAKHDENYMPPEVADALKAAHDNGVSGGSGGTGTP